MYKALPCEQASLLQQQTGFPRRLFDGGEGLNFRPESQRGRGRTVAGKRGRRGRIGRQQTRGRKQGAVVKSYKPESGIDKSVLSPTINNLQCLFLQFKKKEITSYRAMQCKLICPSEGVSQFLF